MNSRADKPADPSHKESGSRQTGQGSRSALDEMIRRARQKPPVTPVSREGTPMRRGGK
jgi:hypothetical protein